MSLSAPSQPLSALQRDARPAVDSSRSNDVPLQALTHHCSGDDCRRPYCKLARRDHFHCGLCANVFSDIQCLREHLSRVHDVAAAAALPEIHMSVNVEPTDMTNNTLTSATSPPLTGGDAAVSQPAAVCSQLASINAENTGLQCTVNNIAERHDNDNDNGGELVIDLSSSGKGRSPSDAEIGNIGDEEV